MIKKRRIGILVFLIVILVGIVTAIGPAPIIVKGFTDAGEIDSVKIEILNDQNETIEQKNDFSIIKINDTLYHYVVTITLQDTLETNRMNIEFLSGEEVIFRKGNMEVLAWENIELNLTNVEKDGTLNEKESEELKIKKNLQRPNTIANELEIQNYEHQLRIKNESFIFEFYNITEETFIEKITNNLIYPIKSTIERPAKFSVNKINGNTNYMIVIVLMVIIMLQFTSLILHRKKKN